MLGYFRCLGLQRGPPVYDHLIIAAGKSLSSFNGSMDIDKNNSLMAGPFHVL